MPTCRKISGRAHVGKHSCFLHAAVHPSCLSEAWGCADPSRAARAEGDSADGGSTREQRARLRGDAPATACHLCRASERRLPSTRDRLVPGRCRTRPSLWKGARAPLKGPLLRAHCERAGAADTVHPELPSASTATAGKLFSACLTGFDNSLAVRSEVTTPLTSSRKA